MQRKRKRYLCGICLSVLFIFLTNISNSAYFTNINVGFPFGWPHFADQHWSSTQSKESALGAAI
jgi:hypothetical protein